jgi:competence protein ComEA
MDTIPEPAPRLTIAAFIIVTIAIIAAVVLLLATRPQPVQITLNPPLPTATPEPSATPAPVSVYVTGAVANPEQIYVLPRGSRVQDALDAAGGIVGEADMQRVNLAAILRDGDQVHVPLAGQVGGIATPNNAGIVYINSATVEELDTLPGVGPELAERIIQYREVNGPFASLDDLDAVEGIGPALLTEIAEMVSFEP